MSRLAELAPYFESTRALGSAFVIHKLSDKVEDLTNTFYVMLGTKVATSLSQNTQSIGKPLFKLKNSLQ